MRTQPRQGGARRRIAIVSGYGRDPVTPRGQRTARLAETLSASWEVSLKAMPRGKPSTARSDGSTSPLASMRQRALAPARRLLLDRWEPWSVRALARWTPHADAGLLIAAPWSPAIYAGRRLSKAGIPYVVDVGDPWVLTTELMLGSEEKMPAGPLRRARRSERHLWSHAAGAIVTTPAQRNALQTLFPQLPILVRPNGYNPVDGITIEPPMAPPDPAVLRLAHFGMLSPHRLDPVPFITELQRCGRWSSIVFHQFGDDFGVGLDELRLPDVRIEHHPPIPWHQVVEESLRFDAVIAIAYPQPSMLPSKTIEYSTLPLPRIALTNPAHDDATRQFLSSRSGWLAVSNGEADLGWRVFEHVRHDWSKSDLAPPSLDAWPEVAAEVVAFIEAQVVAAGANCR